MATRNIVSASAFVRQMTTHWKTTLGNAPSPSLERLWGVVANTFNDAIVAQDKKWRVLEPPTGTGKTQGLTVYCAMLAELNSRCSPENRTGVLVVVRTIAQADEIAAAINEMARRDAAVARHSENKISGEDCAAKDILVITHSAYQLATEAIYRGHFGKSAQITAWDAGPRCLTIIDEALANIVEEYQVTAHSLRRTLSYVDTHIAARHPDAVNALQMLQRTLDQIERSSASLQETILWRSSEEHPVQWSNTSSMGGLLSEISKLPLDQMVLRKESAADRQRLVRQAKDTLRSCEAILTKWAYLQRSGNWDTLNSSELIIPLDIPGPVVLDATASQNMLWELLGELAVRPAIPSGTRNYRNVRLNVAYTKGLGKTTMKERGRGRVARVLGTLDKTHKDRSVLFCVHKNLEPMALDLQPNFANYEVAHWGAIDGRNDWKDCDVAVILGLPFRGPLWATNTFFALTDVRTNDWLRSPSWKSYQDVRKAMEVKQITVSVVQAINRIRCRKVINSEGDCPSAEVFLVLPEDHLGTTVLDNIQAEMPGIQVVPWHFDIDGEKTSVRRAEGFRAIIPYMASRLPGETSMHKVKADLGWSADKMKKLRGVLKDSGHFITRSLRELDVSFHTNGKLGRGSKAWLLKTG